MTENNGEMSSKSWGKLIFKPRNSVVNQIICEDKKKKRTF